MIFDLSFLNLELVAAKTGEIPAELFAHSAFLALAAHEAELHRPVWDETSFRTRFAAAAEEEPEEWSDWGLAPLLHDREKILDMKNWMETEADTLSKRIDEWLERFTLVPQQPGLRCIPYVGSYDAGFGLSVGCADIYLNVPVLFCREGFLETLVHESYHARMLKDEIRKRQEELEGNPLTQLLYITFEEGTANFIGYNGSTTTKYPVIPLRTPEEGTAELKEILWRYKREEITAQEALDAFMQTDCCYTAGGYIAESIWKKLGRDGLELWSAGADVKASYEAFRSTLEGADWPELF